MINPVRINQASNEQIDDAIDNVVDRFEEEWTPESRSAIRTLLQQYQLADDHEAATELIRIDIELRYKQGLSIQLEDYFDQFGDLLTQSTSAAQIAFEDYRLRDYHGHALPVSRWSDLPGVKNELWFQRLTRESTARSRATHVAPPAEPLDPNHGSDAAIRVAIEATGFRIMQEIGRGAFSRVYLATQNELADRFVVLKVVSEAIAESQNMAMLQHTNIVPIYSFDQIHSKSVICMPYAGSVTLKDFMTTTGERSRGSLPRVGQSLVQTVQACVHDTVVSSDAPDSGLDPSWAPAANDHAVLKPLEKLQSLGCNELAIWIFQRLASALAHSHARGVLHGDLKPGNVLIRNDGEPALLDFNLSQSLDRGDARLVGGTLPYMAPETYEALMGKKIALQATSDIYSLGVMLFEFVTGRLPFPTPISAAPIDLEPAVSIRRTVPDWRNDDNVSAGLRVIISRCLEFSPSDRYASADDLRHDLECERANLSLVHSAEPRLSRIRKWFRRHPSTTSGGTVALLLFSLLIPLGYTASVYREKSLHLAAVSAFDSFSRQSADALAAVMADPQRSLDTSVQANIDLLDRHGLLSRDRQNKFVSSLTTPVSRAQIHDAMLRHVGHVGFLEVDRLRPKFRQGVLQNDQLQRLDQLIAAAAESTGRQPSRAVAFLKAARARFANDDHHEELLSKARDIQADSDTEIYLEAVRRMSLHDYKSANELLTSLADRDSIPSTLRWTSLGRSQYGEARYEDAKLSFTQSIDRAPNSSQLRVLRGLCYIKLREPNRAETDFTKAIELDSTNQTALSNRGLLRLGQGRDDEAIKDFSRVLELSPGNAYALLQRARAYRSRGDDELADRDFAQALQTDNVNASSLMARSIYRDDTDPESALQDLEHALSQDPDSPMILMMKARLLSQKLDRLGDAVETYREVTRIQPTNETAIIDRALVLTRLGRYDEAKADLDLATTPPDTPRTLYQAACICALMPDQSSHVRALSFLSRAIRAGYEADRLATDPDLESLRKLPGYRAVSRTYQLSKINSTRSRPQPSAP
ncbi:MAG: protein kinase [Pirellulaceae bacterium]|nr:protein kinase [Pirellulaceae bacterium]